MNADPNTSGHQTRRQMYNIIEILTIEIIVQGTVVTIAKNMVIVLEIALEHTSEVLTIDGWMILYALVILRPVT